MRIFAWDDFCGGQFLRGGAAMTVGSFDGAHLGHRALFDLVLSQEGMMRGVAAFVRSTRGALCPKGYGGDLASLRQKVEILERAGFDFAVLIDFSDEFSKMEGRVFIGLLAERFSLRFLAEGGDFRFGRGGACGTEELSAFSRELGFEFRTAEPVLYGGEKISSSRIRGCVEGSRFASAREMLGRAFEYDCRGAAWRRSERNPREFLAARDSALLLPGRGNVIVHSADGRRIPAVFCGDSENLRLTVSSAGLLPDFPLADFIEFI